MRCRHPIPTKSVEWEEMMMCVVIVLWYCPFTMLVCLWAHWAEICAWPVNNDHKRQDSLIPVPQEEQESLIEDVSRSKRKKRRNPRAPHTFFPGTAVSVLSGNLHRGNTSKNDMICGPVTGEVCLLYNLNSSKEKAKKKYRFNCGGTGARRRVRLQKSEWNRLLFLYPL